MDGKKESARGKVNLWQARIQKVLNSNFQGKETEIKISYQAEPPFDPKGDRRIHKGGCR